MGKLEVATPSRQHALYELARDLAQRFNQRFGETFVGLADGEALHHIVGHSDAGIPLRECLMCGPTVVVQRRQTVGAKVYCRACGGEYELAAGTPELTPTGAHGGAAELEARPDEDLIADLVKTSAKAIHGGGILPSRLAEAA